MKYLFLTILVLQLTPSFCQKSKLVLHNTFTYEAFFIDSKGDTLTKELIKMAFKDSPWKLQKSQSEVVIIYQTDAEGLESFVYPFEKVRARHEKFEQKRKSGKKGWSNWTWLEKEETTGYIFNDSVFWSHPPRGNQYLYTEVSGMSEVHFDQLKNGGRWASSLNILFGWHDFNGRLTSVFEVIEQTNYSHGNISTSAWEISVKSKHSNLGEACNSTILFDDQSYGFVSFDHQYYDGNRIVMNLIKVDNSK